MRRSHPRAWGSSGGGGGGNNCLQYLVSQDAKGRGAVTVLKGTTKAEKAPEGPRAHEAGCWRTITCERTYFLVPKP